MNKQIEALKMAIEALDDSMPLVFGNGIALEMMKTPLLEVEQKVNFHKKAINACKEALAEAEKQEPVACHCGNPTFKPQLITHTKEKCFERLAQEPVGEVWWHEGQCNVSIYPTSSMPKEGAKLYTHPATWKSLSDDEKVSIKRQINNAFNEGFEKGKAMSLVASIPPNFIKLEGIEKNNTHPATWQSLSGDEILKLANQYSETLPDGELFHFDLFADAIEQALKEKNHG